MPRRVDHEARRRHIGAALLDIAAERGLQAVTMREVAARAGVSVRLVQYYFETKDRLLEASWGYVAERLGERIRARAAAIGAGLPPRTLLSVVLGAIVPTDPQSHRDAVASAAFYAAVITGAARPDDQLHFPNALHEYVTGVIRSAQDDGPIDVDLDAPTEAAILLALANGLTSSVLGGQWPADRAVEMLELQLDRLFEPAVPAAHPA
jgi:AcrR family transcriptional regulator